MKHPLKNLLTLAAMLTVLMGAAALRPARARAAGEAYHEVQNWAQLPSGTTWGVMSAVDVDARGNVYAFQRDPGKVIVLDTRGNIVKEWGVNQFPYAHGLNFLSDGSLWLTDTKLQQAIKVSPDGQILMTIGTKEVAGDHTSTTGFNGPSQVVMGAGGTIFVSDGEGPNARIVKFSKDGQFMRFWGEKGTGPGQLDNVHCLAMDSKGLLYACNRANKRIEVFDQDGTYIRQMAQFGAPACIVITKDDAMYVCAGAPENWVAIGTTDGQVTDKITGFNAPHLAGVDANGTLYVAEVAGKNLRKFVKGPM